MHACRGCGLRYIDGCDEIGEDGLCIRCRGGRPWQLLIDNAAPRECCLRARLVTKDERKTYRLAGRANWLICPLCKRTFGHKPQPEEIHS